MVICVAKQPPYPPNCTGPTFDTIQAGLDAAAAGPDKTVVVQGNCGAQRCVYAENVKFPDGGITLVGLNYPIIDGSGNGRTVEFCPNATKPSLISGFEIRGGKTTDENGAGVYAMNTPVTITDNCIHNNTAEGGTGGGIGIDYTSSPDFPIPASFIGNNGIYNNHARHGAGIGARGTYSSSKFPAPVALTIVSNVIGPDNKTAGGGESYGGGISVYQLPVTIQGNDIHHNSAFDYGGGVGAYNLDRDNPLVEGIGAIDLEITGPPSTSAARRVVLNGNHIHENQAWKGGGVAGMWFAVLDYSGNIIENNTASTRQDTHGGGIYGTTAGLHRLTGNVIQKNHATAGIDGRGGGIHASCNAVISFSGDNIVSENDTTAYGGGISLDNADMQSAGGTLYITGNKVFGGILGGLGGGIYMCSSDSTEGGREKKWQPCNHNNTLSLQDAIVEKNSAVGHGAGIAVEKRFAGLNAMTGNVKIQGCIISGNTAQGSASGDGVYFRRTSAASAKDDFELSGSLVEGHSASGEMAGVRLDDHYGQPLIESNIIKGNDVGLDLGTVPRATVRSNWFQQNLRMQLHMSGAGIQTDGAASSVEISGNAFDGRKSTFLGVVLTKMGGSHLPFSPLSPDKFVTKNDIQGHTEFGMSSDGNSAGEIPAKDNWWGGPDGPTRPGGKPAGDKITQEIDPDPFSKQQVTKALPPAPNLGIPKPPTFSPPGAPNCTNLDSPQPNPPPPPGITIIPEPRIIKVPEPFTMPPPEPGGTTTTPTPPPTPIPGPTPEGTTPIPPPAPSGPGVSPPAKGRKHPKRGRWLIVGVILIALIIIATGAYLVFPSSTPSSTTVASSSSTSSSTPISTTVTGVNQTLTTLQGYVNCTSPTSSDLAFSPPVVQWSCYSFNNSGVLNAQATAPGSYTTQAGTTANLAVYVYGSGSLAVTLTVADMATGQTIASASSASNPSKLSGTSCSTATRIDMSSDVTPGVVISPGNAIEFSISFEFSGTGTGTACFGGSATPTGFQVG